MEKNQIWYSYRKQIFCSWAASELPPFKKLLLEKSYTLHVLFFHFDNSKNISINFLTATESSL